MPSPTSSNLPAASVETFAPSGARRRRQRRAGPANTSANATPVDSAPADSEAAFNTVSAANPIETVTRTTQMSIQMFNHSRHSEFHGSSLRSVGGDVNDSRSRSSVAYNYNISLSNITFAANTEVTIHFGQDGNGNIQQRHGQHVGLETGPLNACSQPAVRVVSRGRDDENPLQRGEFLLIGC
ncbi:hypothetical protein D9758_009540 [Tetrapyrgos nigripes]|uniref:Uncharacterized protein n=1 Tax=Tetrapyrgos nigripes TaxID=182062 RepID=A0A8H5G137_9AGAR|nr:hypothetical protein D9758_009540 [Tetrapyrgos nigripes]